MSTGLLPDFEVDDGDVDDLADGPYPALDALNSVQRNALDRFREEGFADRREFTLWLHDLQYHTLGRVPWWWFYDICTNTVALSVVITSSQREEYRDSISPAEAKSERRRLTAKYLRPACRRAYRELRTKATEYLDEDVDFEQSNSFALRPALNSYHDRQHQALTSFLDGFESIAGLEEWLHELDRITNGSINDIERQLEMQFDVQMVSNKTARRAATSPDDPRYQNVRERIAARWILPATNVSVQELALKAGESTETEPVDMPAPPG